MMGVTYSTTYRCDFADCISSVTDAGDTSNWTLVEMPYPVGGMPAGTQVRCPTHKGQ